MFSEDYILRIIRQATSVLAKILGFKNTGQYQEATNEIDQTLGLLFGMDAEFVKLLDDDSLYQLLMKDEKLDLDRLLFIADLFKEEGDIQALQNQKNESNDSYIRSLNYYLMICFDPGYSSPEELFQKIDELTLKLGSYPLEENTLWNLFCYFENVGKFSKADEMINKLADKQSAAINVPDEMKSFYKRLLDKSQNELNAGGMNRVQIQANLEKLK